MDEKQYPWMKQMKPMLRQLIRQELGYITDKETISEVVKEEVEKELPERHNHMWGHQERQELITDIHWYTIASLAQRHQRTIGSIICQLKREWKEGNI